MATPSVFDLASAQRIANAVRRVEIGDRSEAALRFRRETPQQQRKVFRIATFTGSWAINSAKTVTFKYQTATPNTAVATNLFFPFPDLGGTTDCAIAKDGTAWFLVDVPFETATAVFVSSTASVSVVDDVSVEVSFGGNTTSINVVTGITVAAALNTDSCAITVSTTQTTASVEITTGGTLSSTVTKSTANVDVIDGTYTATFLTFQVS